MDRRVRKTRELIKNALIELLREKNISAVTVTELTRRADIDRRTFYLHYDRVEDVITEMEQEAAAEIHELLVSSQNFNLRNFFDGLTQILSNNLEFYRIVAGDAHYQRLLYHCKCLLKAELQSCFFASSGLSELDFDICSEYVTSGIIGVYYSWLCNDRGIPLDELPRKAENAVFNSWNLLTANS